jgi:two-component system KDP operon response regulator KdpE
MKVLIIEDDQLIVNSIKAAFEFRWPEAEVIYSLRGKKGIDLARWETPDIAILDINLPDISGFEVLKAIRGFSSLPVIILTVRAEDEDMMKGLEGGADDYIVKPFNYLTLLARVKAVLRRVKAIPFKGRQENEINTRLSIDFVNQKVKIDNSQVKLTPIEYKLLVTLVKNRDKLVPYNQINAELWDRPSSGDTGNIRLAVQRLREKLKDSPPRMILNKRGTGYIFHSN